LPRFVRGLQLYNEVDCAAGYWLINTVQSI
jgi:hypothetical protein